MMLSKIKPNDVYLKKKTYTVMQGQSNWSFERGGGELEQFDLFQLHQKLWEKIV